MRRVGVLLFRVVLLLGGLSLSGCSCRSPERAPLRASALPRRFVARTDLDSYVLEMTSGDLLVLRVVDESGHKTIQDIVLTGVLDRQRGVMRMWSPFQARTKLWPARFTDEHTMTAEIDADAPIQFKEVRARAK